MAAQPPNHGEHRLVGLAGAVRVSRRMKKGPGESVLNELQRSQSQLMDVDRLRTAIVVFGMHRSGTSAMSGVLHHLGADVPRHLDQANSYNERGYWESHKIQRFNDRL